MLCPYCQTNIKSDKEARNCETCHAPHHKECWEENKGCTTYGCRENPATKKTIRETSVDVGNLPIASIEKSLEAENKKNIFIRCPKCNLQIETDSSFCKQCGHSFEGDDFPESKESFEQEFKKRYREKVLFKRKRFLLTAVSALIIITLLVVAIVSVTKTIDRYLTSEDNKIKMLVQNWKKAWESKDINTYKELLDKDYIYYDKDNKPVPYSERLKRISQTFGNYRYIKIGITDINIKVDSASPNYANVRFRQTYESDKVTETGMKTLRLYKGEENGGKWKIFREIFE